MHIVLRKVHLYCSREVSKSSSLGGLVLPKPQATVLITPLLEERVRGLEVRPLNRMCVRLTVAVLVEVLLLVAVAVVFCLRSHDRADKKEKELHLCR